MSTTYADSAPPAASWQTRVRWSGYLCLAAGVLGALSGLALALVEPAVGTDRFSYPLSAGDFTAAQIWFAVHHLGLLAGLLAVSWAGLLPATRPARWGWGASVLGMAGLTVTELVAIAAADADVDSGVAAGLGAAYGIDCTLLGVGLVAAGVSVWRARTWNGWSRGVLLALGVWVFVPMFPALGLTPQDGARLAIGGWMLLFAALGAALLRRTRSGGPGGPTRTST